jgi:hypothetical protein
LGEVTSIKEIPGKQVSKILFEKPSVFGGRYLFVVMADEDLSAIGWNSRDHLTGKVLISKSDMLFSSNKKTRDWALGKPPYQEGAEKFIAEFQSLKPCLHGSDAHEFAYIGHPCSKRGDETHDCTATRKRSTGPARSRGSARGRHDSSSGPRRFMPG